VLARQALYLFSYFLNRVSHLCLDRPALQSSDLYFPSRWDDRQVPPGPASTG
jgi:hypothetical protein